jgi:hypothetical protein
MAAAGSYAGHSDETTPNPATMSTPELYLTTLFVLNDEARIVSTREPEGTPGPLFFFARGASGTAWAVRADVPTRAARELDALAREEPSASNLQAPLVHESRYLALIASARRPATQIRGGGGPGFVFPAILPEHPDAVLIEDEELLRRHFRGWVRGEIAAGRRPPSRGTFPRSRGLKRGPG